MKRHLDTRAQAGLTILELLFVLAVFGVLCALLYPSRQGCRGKQCGMSCINNLKQLALSEIVWANDRGYESLPAQLSTNAGGLREIALSAQLKDYYKALSNELSSPRILTCPSNRRGPADDFAALTANHLSYFLNADGALTNDAVLHGDRQLQFNPAARGAIVDIEPNTTLYWVNGIHHRNDEGGNVVLTDGSVQTTSSRELRDVFQNSGQERQRIVLP